MNDKREGEFGTDRTRQLWQTGVGRRKSIPKRHYVDDPVALPESTKRLHIDEEEDDHVYDRCLGCEAKQTENNRLKREVSQLLRLTEYQQDDIDKLKKDLAQAQRRNDDLQRRVIDKMDHLTAIEARFATIYISGPKGKAPGPDHQQRLPETIYLLYFVKGVIDKMDHLAVIETRSATTTYPNLRESPRPSSPSSQHLGIQLLTNSPSITSQSLSSSPHDVKMESVLQDDFAIRLGILPDRIERFLETKDSKTISQFTKDVAVCMFGRETLATHSLKGQMSTAHHRNLAEVKPALPADRVEALIEFVLNVYPSTERKVIKSCLREKLNDESKLMKKRLQKELAQNINPVMLVTQKQYGATVQKESSSEHYSDEY